MDLPTSRNQLSPTNNHEPAANGAAHSQDKVLALAFNQDCTSLAMGTMKTYSLFYISAENRAEGVQHDELRPCPNMSRLAYDEVHIIERLFSSSLIALVSNQTPRRLRVCHLKNGTEICSYQFTDSIRGVKLNRSRLVVLLEESIFIHNMRDMKLLHTIREVSSNPDGLCALSFNEEQTHLAYPGSSITGEIQIFDTTTLRSRLVISAHESPLAAMSFDLSGTKIASASNRGTVIRVHDAISGARLFEFRRGVQRLATIYSLTFSPDSTFLATSSNTGTVHIFQMTDQKEKSAEKASSWMSSIGSMLGDVAGYLPKQASEVLTQTRSFATVHLPSTGAKTIIGMNSSNAILKLFVAGYDGVVGVYEVNTADGGECRQTGQYHLFSMNSNAQQTNTNQGRGNSAGGSARIYPPNLLKNDSSMLPLVNANPSIDRTFETATEPSAFPPLPTVLSHDDE